MFVTMQALALCSLLSGTPEPRAEATAPKKDAGVGTTPMDQSNADSDVKLTQAIRQAVVAEDRLSFNAKNVKIITRGGLVTLRGAVNTQAEREMVCAIAGKVAGVTKVDDQLELPKAKAVNNN